MARSGNVLPNFTANNAVDGVLSDIELLADLASLYSLRKQFSNKSDISFGKFGDGIGFATAACLAVPALCHHIVHIVLMSTQKQMFRIAAWRIVAFVEYPQPIRDGAKVQLPTNAMGKNMGVVLSQVPITPDCIAVPEPAIVRRAYRDQFPETFSQRGAGVNPDIVSDDKAYRLPLDMSKLPIGTLGYSRLLPAAAHAQATWIGSFRHWILAPRVMAGNESSRLTFYRAIKRACFVRNRRWLTAAAFAQLGKLKFKLGFLWGILRHVFSASNATDQARVVSATPGVFHAVYHSILAHLYTFLAYSRLTIGVA